MLLQIQVGVTLLELNEWSYPTIKGELMKCGIKPQIFISEPTVLPMDKLAVFEHIQLLHFCIHKLRDWAPNANKVVKYAAQS